MYHPSSFISLNYCCSKQMRCGVDAWSLISLSEDVVCRAGFGFVVSVPPPSLSKPRLKGLRVMIPTKMWYFFKGQFMNAGPP